METLTSTNGDIEWVVVDNGSSDGSCEHLARWREGGPDCRAVIYNDAGTGAARARNQGWRAARGEWIGFLDNDVYLDGDREWLATLLAAVRAEPRAAAASPLLLFPGSPEIVQCAGGGVTASGRFGLLGRGQPLTALHRVVRRQAWAPTAALLVRRAALEAMDGFDEGFDPVPICEDLDLCCRLREAGEELLFVGTAQLRHSEGTTFGNLGYDKRGYWKRHARVIKERWREVMAAGPLHGDEDVAWRPVHKEYGNFETQRVRPVDKLPAGHDLSFFASEARLAGPPPPLRVGIVGCGKVAMRGALPGLAPPGSALAREAAPFLDFGGCAESIVAGVADIVVARAREAARRLGAVRWSADGHDLLARTPMEGVVIATPPRLHAELAAAGLERDLCVLVEKPASASEEDLDELLAACKRSREAFCMVNLPWEFHPAVHALAAAVARGQIGTVRSAAAVFEHAGPAAWAPNARWYFEGVDGGVVRDLGLHALAALERLLGRPLAELEPVQSSPSRALATGYAGETGVRVELGWDAPRPRFAIALSGTSGEGKLDLIPYRGSSGATLHLSGQPTPTPSTNEPIEGGPYRHFVARMRDGRRPLTELGACAGGIRTVLRWAEALDREPA